ncbi:histone-lysine N-methyltransferase SETD2 isoform X4 [Pelobates cultripes]|uniref:[histone H3]-lysine(36) N-trimethyltransferase n=1 Tax=Pelobates cultripes TaxID=61616 RepID=A0AAD1W281_PELCU|nr:histone-lysine N-methyltransferase SETD2 isoform X4 [Pelobates cultripes]
MGDFYDPEHPTEEEENGEAKSENPSRAGFGKASTFKGLSSSRFLPKGTKAKVNLEEQGRQKVSFSFSFTKKTFPNRLLTSLVNEKQNESQNAVPSTAEQISKFKMDFSESGGVADELSPPKPKVELGKIHFKKHLLSVTNKLPAPPPPPISVPLPMFAPLVSPVENTQTLETPIKPDVPDPTLLSSKEKSPLSVTSQATLTKQVPIPCYAAKEPPSPLEAEVKSSDSKDFPVVSVVESPSSQKVFEKADLAMPKEYSHIGKEEKGLSSIQNVKPNPSPEKHGSKSKPEPVSKESESDGDSVQTSSSHRSHELKGATSKEKDTKRCSMSLRSDDVGRHSSSRSKSTKDEKYSSYSKSDRDSRYSYSHSRSDRERRRSRSRSRSRSKSRSDRAPRSSSSYSRSERTHYYESDRRYHKSSPYRTRYSRSNADSRTRDSSDSEDDYRRHSRSSDSRRQTSSSSTSYRDSRTSSHSKYDRDSKVELSRDLDRRGRTSSRSEKDFQKSTEKDFKKSSEVDATKKGSPQKENEGKHQKDGDNKMKKDSDDRPQNEADVKPTKGFEDRLLKGTESCLQKYADGILSKDERDKLQNEADSMSPGHVKSRSEDSESGLLKEANARWQNDTDTTSPKDLESRSVKDLESRLLKSVDEKIVKDEADQLQNEADSLPPKDFDISPVKRTEGELKKYAGGRLLKDEDDQLRNEAHTRPLKDVESTSPRDTEGRLQKYSEENSERDIHDRRQNVADTMFPKDVKINPTKDIEGGLLKYDDLKVSKDTNDRPHIGTHARPPKDSESRLERDAESQLHKQDDRKSLKEEYCHLSTEAPTKPDKAAEGKSPKEAEESPFKETEVKIQTKVETRVSFRLRSNLSKVIPPKQDYVTTRSRSSKWDIEKKLPFVSVRKEDCKSVKKEGSANVPVSKKFLELDLHKTLHLDSKPASNLPCSAKLPISDSAKGSSRLSKRKTQVSIKATYEAIPAPDQTDLSLSPRETWNFVTLSSTEDPSPEELSALHYSESSQSCALKIEDSSVDIVNFKANEAIRKPENVVDEPNIVDHSGSSVHSKDDDVHCSPAENKCSPGIADNSTPLSMTESNKLFVNTSRTMETRPLATLVKEVFETPQEDSQCSKQILKNESCVLSPAHNLEPPLRADQSTSEKIKIDLVSCDTKLSTETILDSDETSDDSSSIVQSQPCDLLMAEVSVIPENNAAMHVAEETITCNEMICDKLIEDQSPPAALESGLSDLSTIKRQSEERERIWDEAVLSSEVLAQQQEIPFTNKDKFCLDRCMEKTEKPMENLDTPVVNYATFETESSKKTSSAVIRAVVDYYSDTEESESAESDSEDTDSDDSSMPRNRLHSVVIVPKNSTIAMEDTVSSPSSHSESPILNDEVTKPEHKPLQGELESLPNQIECKIHELQECSPQSDLLVEREEIVPTLTDVSEVQTSGPVLQAQAPGPVLQAQAPGPVLQAQAPGPVLQAPGPVLQAQAPGPVLQAQAPGPVLQAQAPGPVLQAQAPGPVLQAQAPGPVLQAQAPGPVLQAQAPGPVVQAQAPGPVVQAQAPGPVVQAQAQAPGPVVQAQAPGPEGQLHQSDGVDSTSPPENIELSNGVEKLSKVTLIQELVKINKASSPERENQVTLPSVESNLKTSHNQALPTPAEKPDSRQEKAGSDLVQRPSDFSRIDDGFQAAEDLSGLGWDFSQPEKPSSTYQQPDSSYMYFGYNYPPGIYEAHQSYNKDNGYWDPALHEKPPELIYGKPPMQVPDSLTHCYDEDDEDFNWDSEYGQSLAFHAERPHSERQRENSSVQAHEISSNSTKDHVTAVGKREHMLKADLKERGPFKKRRQELESDYETDADALERKKIKAGLMLSALPKPSGESILCNMDKFRDTQHWKDCSRHGRMPPFFDLIEENVYLTERKKNKSHRDIKRMQCECPPLSKEERSQCEVACGEDCLNRLLMIECSSRCPNGEYCSNRRFQRKQHANVEVILTEKKGWGLLAGQDLKPNAFVLEYCGEVLDHKEFKTRVKEYARNKNIHYYFMALKNDEIIDATQKGNCSRFMNHSCDPNCETQKWTVNGQLRVGFFTTRLVPAGSELTFDYQFQRYGKEAQKCFCGSDNCRGYIGGENRVSIRAAGGKMKKERSRKKDSVDGELEALLENGEGLSDKNQVLSLSRLMVRIETMEQKLTCLKLIRNTQSQSCLKSFLECHGLSLLWIWMAELGDSRGNTSNSIKLQLEIIRTLEILPIPNKNMLEESKILPIIQRWAKTKLAIPHLSEGDGYSSENTSRAHTPLNTPDPAARLNVELEGETPKKLVLRRLKIISENSMDSAVSDAPSEVEVKEAPERVEAQATEESTESQLPKEQEIKYEEKSEEENKPKQLDTAATEEQQLQEPKKDPDPSTDASKVQTPGTEVPETEVKENVKSEETTAVETPSQDEEEGLSDVESERSQEPADKMLDMGDLATKLLEGWKDLKEVYRIPKKSQAEKENHDRWRDTANSGYSATTPKGQGRERDSERSSQRKRRQSPSPPAFYERPPKRGEDRYETPVSSKKKSRAQDRNKLSTEERRKLFEQEVAQREAQKQQQQMQTLNITSPISYESLPYGTQLPPPFIHYPTGYPIQSFVDPTNPNAGKVLLPTPPIDSVPSPNSYDPSQGMVVNPAMLTPQQVSVVQHVPPPMEVPTQQYVAQGESLVPQEQNVAVLPVPAPNSVPTQSYGVWDPNQQAVAVQQQPQQSQPPYPPPPSQPAIYYQGQACQPMYGVPTAYAQTPQPIVQGYTQAGLQYIPGQQMYAAHPQGVVVQQAPPVPTMVAPGPPQALQQPEMGLPANNLLDLPPPSPPKPKTIVLPPSWKTARDPEGKIYYYHVITRQTQWDPPSWDSPGDEGGSLDHEAEMDLGTPTYDENPMKGSKKAKTAEADTSSELAKKSKEVFRKEMSQFIVQCLNPYRKPDCKIGRINTTEDFKHLARKLTHGVMNKELKYCKNPEDLDCNENVKHKTKEYIKKYMQKFGSVYKPKEDVDFE